MRLAYQFAIENELIRADGVEASEFPELAGKFRIYAVPKTIVNDEASIEGALPEEFFLDEILKSLKPPEEGASRPPAAGSQASG